MKYSRSELARAYVALQDRYSPQDLAKGFAPLLLKQRGVRDIEMFSEEVAHRMADAKDTVLATVTSARLLSPVIKNCISLYIQKAEGKKHADITYTVDSSLIGGAVATTSTHVYDFSTRGKIQSIL